MRRLTCGLLRNWAAKLQGPIFLSTACDESDDGAEHRHDCDLLAHGFTPDVANRNCTIIDLSSRAQHQNRSCDADLQHLMRKGHDTRADAGDRVKVASSRMLEAAAVVRGFIEPSLWPVWRLWLQCR